MRAMQMHSLTPLATMLAVLCLALLTVAATAALPTQERYTTRFDNLDIEPILASDRLLNNYFNCLMDRGPCTQEGKELKSILPDALKTACSKCNDKQKEVTEKVLRFLIEKKSAQWNELQAKYDPDGEYLRKYDALALEKGVTLKPRTL